MFSWTSFTIKYWTTMY